jgi:hypothetical protein
MRARPGFADWNQGQETSQITEPGARGSQVCLAAKRFEGIC